MDQNKEIHGLFLVEKKTSVQDRGREKRYMTNDEYLRSSFKRCSTDAIVWLSDANN